MIECMNVYKRYPTGTNALYDINVKVDQGEFIYIIGPTGSGKSTLIKLLDGEEKATKGKVKVVGIDVGTLRRSQIPIYRRNIGVVFQDFRLLPTKTVFENISYALEVINMKKKMIRVRVKEPFLIGDAPDCLRQYADPADPGIKKTDLHKNLLFTALSDNHWSRRALRRTPV